jgi:hypothetical protein
VSCLLAGDDALLADLKRQRGDGANGGHCLCIPHHDPLLPTGQQLAVVKGPVQAGDGPRVDMLALRPAVQFS